MLDIWAFLLQTLTVSGIGALLLVVKRIFTDKLPPNWQFASWGLLGAFMIIPAGIGGRYTLFQWKFPVEFLKMLFGDYSETKVLFPFPFLNTFPKTITQWLFFLYAVGVFLHLAFYFVSYVRLRLILRKGKKAEYETKREIEEMARKLSVMGCKIIVNSEVKSAFVCGIIRPVLVLPEGNTDSKIILHELIHLKLKDTLWSVIICILRSIHWCNPFLVYCGKCALNDMEYRCDQFVLERLEGNERREYGHILLSMVNESFAKTAGATCINNGGKSIKRRIETIARFKRYPHKMGLVALCILLVLGCTLFVGTQPKAMYEFNYSPALCFYATAASAKSTACTTAAGAIDTYAKAVIEQNGFYRLMCADEEERKALLNTSLKDRNSSFIVGDNQYLYATSNSDDLYVVLNLTEKSKNVYEAQLAFPINEEQLSKEDKEGEKYNCCDAQKISVKKEKGRWSVSPLSEMETVCSLNISDKFSYCDLYGKCYSADINDATLIIKEVATYKVKNEKSVKQTSLLYSEYSVYEREPILDAEFSTLSVEQETYLIHRGSQEERDKIDKIAISSFPVYEWETEKEITEKENFLSEKLYFKDSFSSSSTDGITRSSVTLNDGWGPVVNLQGSGESAEAKKIYEFPKYFSAFVSVDDGETTKLTFVKEEGN